jgi:hypothetical protein
MFPFLSEGFKVGSPPLSDTPKYLSGKRKLSVEYTYIYIHIYADCRPDAGACSVLEYLQGHQPGYGTCSDDLAPVVFIRACEHPK